MLHGVDIEFLFLSFELLRLERQQILLDLDLLQIDLWDEFHGRKAVLKASGTSFSGREAADRTNDKIEVSLRAASQILNKTKDFFESLKYYFRM